MSWLEVAKRLPAGHKTRMDCDCGSSSGNTLLVSHNAKGYSCYCFSCGEQDFEHKGVLSLTERKELQELNDQTKVRITSVELPEDCAKDFPLEARLWLYSAGITPHKAVEVGIRYSPSYKRVVLPVYNPQGDVTWYQMRAVFPGQTPKYHQPSAERDTVMYLSHPQVATGTIVVTEDIVSAIRVGEVTPAASLLGTKITTAQAAYLGQFDKVLVWLDNDRAGIQGAAKVRKALELLTETRNITSELDPKKYSSVQIEEIIR